MTDPLQTTQKGYWLVNGVQHSSLPEAFQDAGNRAQESPGTVIHVTPPAFEVVYMPPATSPSDPPSDPPPSQPTVTGQILTADKTEIHVGDTFTVSAELNYSDGSSKPVGSYRLYGYDGSVVTTPAPSRTTFTALSAGATTIRNDFDNTTGKLAVTVLAADPPPSDPPPSDPPPSDPPPSPPPPPPPDDSNAPHRAIVKSTIDGMEWTAQAGLGDDYTSEKQARLFVDASGNTHPALIAVFFADGCNVGAMRASGQNDYAGSLTIEYDGAVVFDEPSVKFKRGAANKTIRYGVQPDWHPVDASLFPTYKVPSSPLALEDLSKYDWSFNAIGDGCSGMGDTGSRKEIAWVPSQLVPHVIAPSDDTYAIVRAVEDQSGYCPIYFLTDTGDILDVTVYPNASMEPYSQGNFKNNPIAKYLGTHSGISGSPYTYDEAHHPGYNIVGAATTNSARDKWHLSVWANAALIAANPSWHSDGGWTTHAQTRGLAWGLRSLLCASHLSDRQDYFAARLDDQRRWLAKYSTHPLGFLGTQPIRSFKDGSKGEAGWECNFVRQAVAMAYSLDPDGWAPINDRFKTFLTGMFAKPYWMLAGTTNFATQDAAGNPLTSFDDVVRHTLTGNWSDADIATALDPATTPEQVGQLIYSYWIAKVPDWQGRAGDFNEKYQADSGGHVANLRAAVALMCGDGTEWAECQSTPTKPNYSDGWGWNIVPRAA